MAVRSKRLAGPTTLPATDTSAYTVPDGETAIVKWLQVCNITGTARDVRVSVDTGSGPIELLRHTVAAATSLEIPLWWALAPGNVLSWRAAAASALNASIHGAELEGVAD